MARRGKLERADDQPDAEIRGPARRVQLTAKERAAFDKDVHLLEAALQAEKVVVTRDQRLIKIVNEVKKVARKLRSITFIDPTGSSVADLGR